MSEAQYLLKYVLNGNSVPLNSISHETKIELVYRLADYIIENGEKYKDMPIGINMYLRCLNIESCTSQMLDKVIYELSMFIQNNDWGRKSTGGFGQPQLRIPNDCRPY